MDARLTPDILSYTGVWLAWAVHKAGTSSTAKGNSNISLINDSHSTITWDAKRHIAHPSLKELKIVRGLRPQSVNSIRG